MEQIQMQINQMIRQATSAQSTKKQKFANSGSFKQ
jgi:hypothetical protein